MIKVALFGANGKMGKEVVQAVNAASDMELVQEINRGESLVEKADVVIDFTHPNASVENSIDALGQGANVVIGTSGLSQDGLSKIESAAKNNSAFYIPNFSIGAVLMMKFSAEAAKYLAHVEIIEMHHENKADAPSGTAIRTAEMIASSSSPLHIKANQDHTLAGARGALVKNVPIHSVRLPGLLAHQQVLLGAPGELLTLRHDSTDRKCFMPGVLLAVRSSLGKTGLTIGLENLLT